MEGKTQAEQGTCYGGGKQLTPDKRGDSLGRRLGSFVGPLGMALDTNSLSRKGLQRSRIAAITRQERNSMK